MNIFEAPAEVFSAAPVKVSWPKLAPNIVVREHIEGGVPTIVAMVPLTEGYYHLTPQQWHLMQLFDGERSFAEIAELFSTQTGTPLDEQDVVEFASAFEKTPLFFKSAPERSAALMQALLRERRHGRKREFDPSEINVVGWDPDRYLGWIHSTFRFVYARWFTLITLVAFGFMAYVFASHWGEIWRDTFEYYTFADKGVSDLVEFWFLFGVMVFFHESAHGLTCKHYGGEVHRMGFMLMYLCPAFFCDVSEAWVYATKWQRVATMIAGIWIELILCTFATLVWWGTPTGMWIHDFAYKLILVSGVGVVVLNLNPLLKLDGYYILGELIGISDLKERSSAYVSNWSRALFRLPGEREYLPRRRRWGFITYAVLSSLYGYLLLFVVVRWTYNVTREFSAEWAFVPALVMVWLVFRKNLRRLGNFMKVVYLDKKDGVRRWLTPARAAVLGAMSLVLLFLPIWRDIVQSRFVLEPTRRAVVRAEIPGRVTDFGIREGQYVHQGDVIARLRNLQLESELARAKSELAMASNRAVEAELKYTGYGAALKQKQERAQALDILSSQAAKLELIAPIDGFVVSPRPHNLLGSYVDAGIPIAEIADTSLMHARLYIPGYAMKDVRVGESASVHVDGMFERYLGQVRVIAPASSQLEPGLVETSQYEGIHAPRYFIADVAVRNPGTLRDGQVGEAKILVAHRSAAALIWRAGRDFLNRRIW